MNNRSVWLALTFLAFFAISIETHIIVSNPEINLMNQTELLNANFSIKEIEFLSASEYFDSNKKNAMEETIRFLDEGEKSLNLSKSRDIVIVVGNTGAGKTTFSHFAAGDNDKLVAVRADDDPYSTDFVIEDNLNKISNRDETTISKTIIPELLIDEEGIVWYDCPGFSDTRNTTVEIATTYFVKQVIDHAKQIKVVFVVNHASVSSGLDRSDFDTLVRHAANLIRDVKQYKLSIALIVTKVEAYPPRSTKPLPQWIIAKRTGAYIEKYRKGLIDDRNDIETARVLDFIAALLNQDSTGNFTQIGVFFRPDQEGPLSKNPLLKKNRVEVRDVIKNNLKYSEVDENDFGFTLSAKAQIDIADLAQLISQNVTESVQNVGEQIILFFKHKQSNVKNLMSRKNIFNNATKGIADLKDINQKVTLKSLLSKIDRFLADQQVFIPKSDLENILNQQKYLEFLDRVSTKLLPISTNDWIAALQKCFDYISTEENWYTFLADLYDKLSEYNIQKDLEFYDVADISKWGQAGGARGIFIHHYNFKQFLALHPKFYYLLKDIKIDDTKLATVNGLLNVTLKHEIEYKCEGDKMTVRREYLRLSEIDLKKCGPNIKRLHLFALNTFFTDSNLDFRGDGREVATIANKLVVTTNSVFLLHGEDNKFVPKEQREPDIKHLAGDPGVPGEPGTNGVNFYALFNEVVNGERLVVNATGGAGSIGQDGGRAFPRKPDRPDASDGSYFQGDNRRRPDGEYTGTANLDKLKQQRLIRDYAYVERDAHLRALDGIKRQYSYRGIIPYYIYTECCAADGLAGAGGVGGYGGGTKFISLLEDKIRGSPKILNHDGKNGTNGTNVEPCETMKIRSDLEVQANVMPIVGLSIISLNFYGKYLYEDEKCPKKPNIGFNTAKQNFPAAQLPFRPYEPIIFYKTFLRERLNTGIRNYDLSDFYEKIEQNSEVHATYTVHGLARDLQSLENHFYALNNEIDFIPFYESFLSRIERYGQSNINETSYEDRKILTWLYTSALSKVQGLKTNRYTSLVIDIQSYFDSSIRTIQELSDANKEKIINKHKDNYKKELDAKIEEATKFINKDITPEIDSILDEFDVAMDGLLEETISKQNQTKDEIKELEEVKKKLERNLLLRALTGIFKGIGQIVGYLGPIGAAAGAGINTVTSIGESFIVDPDEPKKRFTLPSGVKDTLDKIGTVLEKRIEKKIEAIGKEIEYIEKFLNEPEAEVVSKDTKKKVAEIKKALEEEKKSATPNKQKVDELTKELKTLTIKERLKLKEDQKDKKEAFKKKATKVFERVGKVLEVIETSIEIYQTVKDDQAKIDEIASRIESSKNQLMALTRYENEIYESMLPMLFEAKNDFKRFESSLGGQSVVALDVQRWKVQSKLTDLKETLVLLTKDFGAESELKRTVEKLTEAIVTLIDIYDRIQAYEEQEKLVTYIGALHSAAFEKIQIRDPEMNYLINDLRIIIHSNVILSQYLNAVQNFKQTVFPFAGFYLDAYNLPSFVNWNKDVPQLVKLTTQQIGQLSDKIKELNESTINQNDEYINTGYFNGENAALDPFYLWKLEDNKEDISDLLSGKRIFLRADVTQSLRWNAVKFSQIGIEFNIRNSTDKESTTKLKEILNNVHITMTHSGNSYYRCNNQFYLITSPSQTLKFSYERTGGEPTTKNAVYEKLRNGNIILSPYTLWAVQLERGDFKALEKYRDLIDIELYGYGQYVSKNVGVCNTNLQKYYRLDESLSEVNNLNEDLLVETPFDKSNYLELSYLINN